MAFMTPHYTNDTFWRLEMPNGESEVYPELNFAFDAIKGDNNSILRREDGATYTLTRETGWWCRLSADGYMDCTEWSGPFDTEEEAREHIKEQYDVDPDTGDELEEE